MENGSLLMLSEIIEGTGVPTFAEFTIVFLVEQKSQNFDPKWDLSRRKFRNIESPKMVSKRL